MSTLELASLVCGDPVDHRENLDVRYPYDGSLTGTVALATPQDLERAISSVCETRNSPLSRYQRHEILESAGIALAQRAEEFAQIIRLETGLCMRETRYEVGRAQDVLQFAASAALKDDGEVFSCDISRQGKARKIFTVREPLKLAAAITPFNHPLNQVAHKVAPAIAAGTPIILKPSAKTPLTAIRFAELLYEAGLPGWMLSVLVGEIEDVVEPLIRDDRVKLVTFTGGTPVGKRIASIAGYKKLCLELGGNSPMIVLEDADLELAVNLAAEGCYRNSGQRCTAVKRLLVHDAVLSEFTKRLVHKTSEYVCGDPADEATRVGTVIDEAAAITLEQRIAKSVQEGAQLLCGGQRDGALLHPSVISNVPRTTEMVCEESFGPLAPILAISDLDDAISLANASNFGLSSAVITNDLAAATRAIKSLETGTVNINQVPGYRIELSPFGGIKDSGLGIKEGVIEAIKYMTNVKTFSLPW
jgi:putative phosphonoacetaldehyde dehydrogenase